MKKPIIIAEAGVNHNGSLKMALEMIDAAASAGADYIKFQTFKADRLVAADAEPAGYQKVNCDAGSQLEMLEALELTADDFITLYKYCRERNIGFLSTPFDVESVRFIASLKPDFIKIPSGEVTDFPLLREVALAGIPVIASTGMATMQEITEMIKVLLKYGLTEDKITLLHCNTQYPTPFKDVNLASMATLSKQFNVKTGYSDHTSGFEVSVAAAALGAYIIEKHFTLNKDLPGPDHKASLNPDELKDLVNAVRNVTMALGSDCKPVTDSEKSNIIPARKSIVAATDIEEGELFTETNITAKRPSGGLSPMRWEEVIGKRASRRFPKDSFITI